MNLEGAHLSKLNYVKNVLGAKQVFRPKGPVRVYGVLKGECLVLADEHYEDKNKDLIARIMKALKIKSYDVVCVDALYFSKQETDCLLSVVKNVIARSAGCKYIAFGSLWLEALGFGGKKAPLNQIFKFSPGAGISVKAVVTYSLSELSSGDKSQIRQRKLSAFSALKAL